MTDTQGIPLPRQEWFDSHYHWAANIVGTWIGEEIDMRTATLVDFGCGDGTTGLGVADHFAPRKVVGIDIRDSFRNIGAIATHMAPTKALPPNISFVQIDPADRLADRVAANAVFSWSCFEHIERRHLAAIFRDIHDLLPVGGVFFLQIEPLYFSPHGSHLAAYIEQPWGHLLLSEDEVRERVRAAGVREQAKEHMRDAIAPLEQRKSFHLRQYFGLNRVTADEIVQFGRQAGFAVKKEMRTRVDLAPPRELVERHGLDALRTNEIRVLFKKTRRFSIEHLACGARQLARALRRH